MEVIVRVFVYTGSLLYVLSLKANSVAIQTPETREIQIGLKRDGNLIDTKKIPKCGSDKIIHLVSYKYHQLECIFASYFCSSVYEKQLLPEDEFRLHQRCSMQHQCRNLSFPLRSEAQRNRTNSIIIRYECIDQERLVNICEKVERTFSDAVYLTLVSIKGPFKKCECFFDSGRFTISVTDIRLNDNMDNKCSPATLHINYKEFRCDETRKDFAAVFTNSAVDPLSNAYISVVQNSETALPEMVQMILQPERSLKIRCEGQQTTRIINVTRSTSTERSISTSKPPATTTVHANDDVTRTVVLSSTNDLQKHIVLLLHIVVTLLTVILAMMMIFYIWIYKRKRFFRRMLASLGRKGKDAPGYTIRQETEEILPTTMKQGIYCSEDLDLEPKPPLQITWEETEIVENPERKFLELQTDDFDSESEIGPSEHELPTTKMWKGTESDQPPSLIITA